MAENLAKAGDLSPLRTFYDTECSEKNLTRYMAVFLGSPKVSVIPQVFLNSSFGICATMPKLAYCGAKAQRMQLKCLLARYAPASHRCCAAILYTQA